MAILFAIICAFRFLSFLRLALGGEKPSEGRPRLGYAQRTLRDYVVNGGGKVHPSLRMAQIQIAGDYVRGVVTTTALDEGKVILRVPPSLWLMRKRFLPEFMAKDLSVYEACTHFEAAPHDILFAAGLLLERMKGDASPYAPYFNTLPPPEELRDMTPGLAEPELMGSLVSIIPVQAGQSILVAYQWMEKCFQSWQDGDDDVRGLNFDDVKGFINLITRAFAYNDDHVLMPYADMLNTGTIDAINVRWGYFDGSYIMYTLRQISAGEELISPYCEKSCDNIRMVWTYGIYLENNPNHIYPMAKLPACSDMELRREALSLLEDASRSRVAVPDKTAPRCKQNESVHFEMIQCVLARLAWEACGCRWESRQCPADATRTHTDL